MNKNVKYFNTYTAFFFADVAEIERNIGIGPYVFAENSVLLLKQIHLIEYNVSRDMRVHIVEIYVRSEELRTNRKWTSHTLQSTYVL